MLPIHIPVSVFTPPPLVCTTLSLAPIYPAAKARGSYLRTHFKHCREIMGAIRGMKFNKAVAYLEDVLNKKQAIPYTVFNRGCGRSAQAKNLKVAGSLVRWPQKATKMILALLQNAKANAEVNVGVLCFFGESIWKSYFTQRLVYSSIVCFILLA